MDTSITDAYKLFEEEVKRNFSFLEHKYDFHLSHIKNIGTTKAISYVSSFVYVILFYGAPAYEPEISFGRLGIDDMQGAYSFNQGDLILLNCCSKWQWSNAYPNNLAGLISEFARLLEECGASCLNGNQALFEEMKARRDSAVKVWHQEERAFGIRKDAENAWRKKDYTTIVRLYETITELLTGAESKKLDYAKKQLLNENGAESFKE